MTGRAVAPTLALVVAAFSLAAPVRAQEPAADAWREWSSIIEPSKYGDDFTRYDYVNPDAPKGGTLNLAGSGSFDSFNPFVLRGTAAAGFAAFGGGLAYDTLMDQALDEPGVSHGLIAEAMRYPADYSSVSFRLDPDARWHDGQPITVDDVIWSVSTQDGMQAGDMGRMAEAQGLGYAEADPTFDIGGFDAAHKLAILTSLAFGCEIDLDAIYIEGISQITLEDIRAASELGFRIKLLAVAQRTDTGIEQRVHPTMIPANAALARVDGVVNAVAVDTDLLGSILLAGPGAGGAATASAVLSDILDVAAGTSVPTLGIAPQQLAPYRRARMRAHEGGYYIRLQVADEVGAFAAIARRMAENQISLESIVQRRREDEDGGVAPVILITHDTTEAAVRKALDAVQRDGHLRGDPRMIRIEKLA